MGFILMYDVTNEESFSSVHDWCTQIKTYSWDNAQVILVGNKCDMEDERVISFERGKQLADSLGLEFFETSAKENINVRVSILVRKSLSFEKLLINIFLSRLCSSAWWTSSVTRCPRALTPTPACSAQTRAPGWTAHSPPTSTATVEGGEGLTTIEIFEFPTRRKIPIKPLALFLPHLPYPLQIRIRPISGSPMPPAHHPQFLPVLQSYHTICHFEKLLTNWEFKRRWDPEN